MGLRLAHSTAEQHQQPTCLTGLLDSQDDPPLAAGLRYGLSASLNRAVGVPGESAAGSRDRAPAASTNGFGALLRRHRMAAGLTQEALAERAGLSVYGIQKLERGITTPYRDTALRLEGALELSQEDATVFRSAIQPVRRRGSPQPLAPLTRPLHNLPVPLTSFIGREEELATLPRLLQSARLLTLTGVGGSGKTRLAIETG